MTAGLQDLRACLGLWIPLTPEYKLQLMLRWIFMVVLRAVEKWCKTTQVPADPLLSSFLGTPHMLYLPGEQLSRSAFFFKKKHFLIYSLRILYVYF